MILTIAKYPADCPIRTAATPQAVVGTPYDSASWVVRSLHTDGRGKTSKPGLE